MNAPCTVNETDGVTVVEFTRDTHLDAVATEAVQTEVFGLVESDRAPRILLYMENVSFISSLGLGFLLALRVKAARKGSELALSGLRPALFDLFKVTQLDQLYTFYPARADAITQLRTKTPSA